MLGRGHISVEEWHPNTSKSSSPEIMSRPCKTATSPMNTGRTRQKGLVRTLGFVCNDAQFLGVGEDLSR